MGEKKEKQFAVVKIDPTEGKLVSIVWFDARKDAREYRKEVEQPGGRYQYEVHPMTRGPRA